MPAPTIQQEIKILEAQIRTHGINGFYILEQALKNLCESKSEALIEINRCLINETPGYIKMRDLVDGAIQAEQLQDDDQTGITHDSYGHFDQ